MTPSWDPSLVAQLVSAGCNARAISVVFGLSKNAVLGRLHRDKQLNKLWTDKVAAERPRRKKYKPAPVRKTIVPPPELSDPPSAKKVTADWGAWEEREGKKRAMEVKMHPAKPHMLRVPLLNLGANQCRWPVEEAVVTGGYLFCAASTEFGQTYCRYHRSKSLAGKRDEPKN
jgi:hypothetical protein